MTLRLYRVFSYVKGAADTQPGGAFYIPPQGAGRIDNPEHYQVLYVSSEAEAAVAESFGSRPTAVWSDAILRGHPRLPGSIRAMATFELSSSSAVCNLDEPRELISQRLSPSIVITRDYTITQAWALRVFEQNRAPRWIGVRWWSYYEGRWSSIGLWQLKDLRLVEVTPLDLRYPSVVVAAQTIGRQIRHGAT